MNKLSVFLLTSFIYFISCSSEPMPRNFGNKKKQVSISKKKLKTKKNNQKKALYSKLINNKNCSSTVQLRIFRAPNKGLLSKNLIFRGSSIKII